MKDFVPSLLIDRGDNVIQMITDFNPYLAFIQEINSDMCFSDPMLSNDEQIKANLLNAIYKSDNKVLGVFNGNQIIGLFVFLIIDDEKYIEMLVGLSKEKRAYEEIMAYLVEHYKGYKTDFVYNPKNQLLQEQLEKQNAFFYPEQLKMVLRDRVSYTSNKQIELYSDIYKEQYLQMHSKDGYWTGEKVLEASNRFRVLLAIEDGDVVGYTDVTYAFDENEPFDMFVKEEYRRNGYGKAMMAKAIELNEPKSMMLLVDYDNAFAIALYESLGFVRVERENNITASLIL